MGIPDLEKTVTKNGKTVSNLLTEWNKDIHGIRTAIISCSNEMSDIANRMELIQKENKKLNELVKKSRIE